MPEIQIREYVDAHGASPWARWREQLDGAARARVTAAVYRLSEGNFSNVKGVGEGVFERVIDWGPGYRVYFGKDGDSIVILLGGSSKRRQQAAIVEAKRHWADYRRRSDL